MERWILLAYASRSLSVRDGVLLLTLRKLTVFGGDKDEEDEVEDILWILLKISCWCRTWCCCCCCWWWWWRYLAAADATCRYFKCFVVCINTTLSMDSVELFLVDDCVFVDGTRSVSCFWSRSSMSGTIWTSNNNEGQYLHKGDNIAKK